MVSIPKAHHRLEHRDMTVREYEQYLSMHPRWRSLKALICVECGDEIAYCSGDIKGSYFKHNPSSAGHSYCSLYHEGSESKTNESLIRKKLFKEEDISLNFELRMTNGKWSSLITIPPFKNNEIETNERNKTTLFVRESYRRTIEIPVDREHFSSGEMKRIGLEGFPSSINIAIKGNSSSHNISYTMDGFSPRNQIYSTLITQDYSSGGSGTINLSKIKMFNCKKVSGRIYTGRHYLLFEYGYYGFRNTFSSDEAIVKEVILPKDPKFNYSVYDVIFKNVTEKTVRFCEDRDCELIEKSEAVIIWPPINSIGNYKYFRNSDTEMFLIFEHDNETLDMFTHSTKYIFFKIDIINAKAFYVTALNSKAAPKEQAICKEAEMLESNFNPDTLNYLFTKGILNKRIDEKKYTLKKNESVISILNRLEIEKYICPTIRKKTSDDEILAMIRYSEKFVPFSENEYEYLIDKYRDNSLVSNYLDSCLEYKYIKEVVKDYLMEEKL